MEYFAGRRNFPKINFGKLIIRKNNGTYLGSKPLIITKRYRFLERGETAKKQSKAGIDDGINDYSL